MNIQSSFTVYTAALHALILNPLLLAYFWLGLSWIDSIDSISANKRFSSSKTSSRKPYSNSKQQEKQKHSAENTINFSAGIREAKVEVDKDELSKLMSQGTKLAKEIQEIKRNWVPRSDNKNKENNQNDQNKDKDKKPRNRRRKGVNEVDAEETAPTSTPDAP